MVAIKLGLSRMLVDLGQRKNLCGNSFALHVVELVDS